MKSFKWWCAIAAFSYLIAALLPMQIFLPQQHLNVPAVVPEWVGRGIYFAEFCLFSAVFYGVQKKIDVFWKIIPILLGMYLLSALTLPLFTLTLLSLPWLPFLLLIPISAVCFGAFIIWWRKQRSYFVTSPGT